MSEKDSGDPASLDLKIRNAVATNISTGKTVVFKRASYKKGIKQVTIVFSTGIGADETEVVAELPEDLCIPFLEENFIFHTGLLAKTKEGDSHQKVSSAFSQKGLFIGAYISPDDSILNGLVDTFLQTLSGEISIDVAASLNETAKLYIDLKQKI